MRAVLLTKFVKKWGNSTVIILNKEDKAIIKKNFSELNSGDLLELKVLKVSKK